MLQNKPNIASIFLVIQTLVIFSVQTRVELQSSMTTHTKHKLGEQRFLENSQNLIYKSTIYVGASTGRQALTTIFDTKTDWFLVQTTSCGETGDPEIDCPDKYLYDTSESSTYDTIAVESSLTYGDLTFDGYLSEDTVCLDSVGLQCVIMNLYEATYASSNFNEGILSDVSSIVGLSRSISITANANLLVEEMATQGQI